jgi:hypothetical protein
MELGQSQQAINHYARAYQQLYKRTPKDLRLLADDWVTVNGARMRVVELEFLTRQLETEYRQHMDSRRSVVDRLIGWLTKH